jgi:hypothetical protein
MLVYGNENNRTFPEKVYELEDEGVDFTGLYPDEEALPQSNFKTISNRLLLLPCQRLNNHRF